MSSSAAAGGNNDNSHPPELHAKWLGVRVVVDAPRKKVTTTPVSLSKNLCMHVKVQEVRSILTKFTYPYNRRIAGQHGHFTMEDYRKWLEKAGREDLARALRRLAQLSQAKVYLFWKR